MAPGVKIGSVIGTMLPAEGRGATVLYAVFVQSSVGWRMEPRDMSVATTTNGGVARDAAACGRIWRLRLAGQVPGVRDGQLLPGRAHNRDAAEFRRASSSATPTTCMPGRCAPWRAWIDEAPLASAARTRPAGRETLEARPSTFWRPPGPIWNARASRQLGWQSRKCNRAEPRYELRVPMVTVLVQGIQDEMRRDVEPGGGVESVDRLNVASDGSMALAGWMVGVMATHGAVPSSWNHQPALPPSHWSSTISLPGPGAQTLDAASCDVPGIQRGEPYTTPLAMAVARLKWPSPAGQAAGSMGPGGHGERPIHGGVLPRPWMQRRP
ncbi:hypothetical protein PCL_08008 [Purpureocillium lilacinum]|uniref:Uncharacterized protein n=1 Tax=Purpureocillium lilacinum TaxID=33203 RepID=A0A2U3EJK1_PURLI|nr:hypothetical protein PCL_08008 [Purpureocillium lilacinum]